MNKEKFLELAGQIYDSTNNGAENKVAVSKVLLDEITDRISSELFDLGENLVDDIDFEIRGGNEIFINTLRFDFRVMERTIKGVLDNYFVSHS